MAAENKTIPTSAGVMDFIHAAVPDEQQRTDSAQLIRLMQKWSGEKPRMWGSSIIGFGSYHYIYASGREGDAPIISFSPRKAQLSLYIYSPVANSKPLLSDLGKYKMGKACIYVKRLSDINIAVLEKLAKISIAYIREHHECACRTGR